MENFINQLILSYFLIINSAYGILLFISLFGILKYLRRLKLVNFDSYFTYRLNYPISIIAPAYNEELTVTESVKSLLMLKYPEFELIVVNDGSKDKTLEVLKTEFDLVENHKAVRIVLPHAEIKKVYRSKIYSNLMVVDKSNGGKADALNAGINCAKHNLVCSIDADSILEKDALLRASRPFQEDPERTMAVGGIVRIANGCTIRAGEVKDIALPNELLPMFQIIEYFRAFLAGRVGFSVLNCLLIISGAFGIFRKDMVNKVGGYNKNTVGEDMELVVKIHKHCLENKIPYKIEFTPDPVCWTEAPDNLTILGRQRSRWQRGTIETMVSYRKMLFNPKYKLIGMFAMPFFLIFEMFSPLIELVGYIYAIVGFITGFLNVKFMILFFVVAILFGSLLSIISVFIEELSFKKYPKLSDVIKIVVYSFIENIGYRQITAVWRLRGFVDYFSKEHAWGEMTRKGFKKN